MDIKDRLKEIRDYAKMGQTKFEKYTGISGGYFSKVKSSIGSDTILKIVDKFPEINIDWLITGNGEMLKPQQPGINNKFEGSFSGGSFVGGHNVGDIISGNGIKGSDNYATTQLTEYEREMAALKSQIELQNKLLEEKERLIQILLDRK